MADVMIREAAFGEARLQRLAKLAGGVTRAMGLLVFLWHDSQEAKRTWGTREEILGWCRIKEGGSRIIDALLVSGYIAEVSEGKYEIRGNAPRLNAEVKAGSVAQDLFTMNGVEPGQSTSTREDAPPGHPRGTPGAPLILWKSF